ncbi:MAG: glycosyltransferase [Burkholderiaceae bacterium]|nr:glycosyltransferase [Burkholderiaceae bacterium]
MTAPDLLPISVNICTYNEARDIGDCLDKVFANHPAEVIVIDGGSTDDTVAIARARGARVIQPGVKGLSSQRQAGIDAATQPYLAIIDGDDHVAPDFLATLLRELQTHGYDALLGREQAFQPRTYWERAMGSTNHGITYTETPVDTNMVGRPSLYRTAALRHCGFDPFFDGVGDEDTDLSIRMELAGFRQGIGTGLTLRQQTPGFGGIVRKFVKYGRGDARIVYKYPFKAGKLLFHLVVRYPFIRGFNAVARGEGVYWPFYLMYGWVRAGALLPELLRLWLRRPAHGPYPTRAPAELCGKPA